MPVLEPLNEYIASITSAAESVDAEEQPAYLKECGCDTAQGFYFSPAVSYVQLTQMIKVRQD